MTTTGDNDMTKRTYYVQHDADGPMVRSRETEDMKDRGIAYDLMTETIRAGTITEAREIANRDWRRLFLREFAERVANPRLGPGDLGHVTH